MKKKNERTIIDKKKKTFLFQKKRKFPLCLCISFGPSIFVSFLHSPLYRFLNGLLNSQKWEKMKSKSKEIPFVSLCWPDLLLFSFACCRYVLVGKVRDSRRRDVRD
ncbi:hypothetical protein ES332_D04G177100v1 [Gossypium tomentosum]|uniref:Uncharacterized protein n=1 Tax=Gossypium tomentosum TaxID=34277 RepID=A0A5D2LF47_GOSTO|nr:hypothetical protein ES332_D04G177100v1 [Gossypium tomentosum]